MFLRNRFRIRLYRQIDGNTKREPTLRFPSICGYKRIRNRFRCGKLAAKYPRIYGYLYSEQFLDLIGNDFVLMAQTPSVRLVVDVLYNLLYKMSTTNPPQIERVDLEPVRQPLFDDADTCRRRLDSLRSVKLNQVSTRYPVTYAEMSCGFRVCVHFR